MAITKYQVAEVIPHSGGMILIDEIVDYNDDSLVASVTITNSSLFGDAIQQRLLPAFSRIPSRGVAVNDPAGTAIAALSVMVNNHRVT